MPSTTKQKSISLIIPIHNEALYLKKIINGLVRKLKQLLFNFEIILVENGSQDKTLSIANQLQHTYSSIKVIQIATQSYGQAIKIGILNAKKPFIFVLNLDLIDYDFITTGFKILHSVPVVIGSKTHPLSQDFRPINRRLTTTFFNYCLKLFTRLPVNDTHGPKGFKATPELFRSIKSCLTNNELLDTELIIKLFKKNIHIAELPIQIHKIRPSRYSLKKRCQLTFKDIIQLIQYKYFLCTKPANITIADDYGYSNKINQSIKYALKTKQADSVSILANFASLTSIKSIVKQHLPFYSVHINLVEGQAVTPKKQIPTLVNRQDQFYPLSIFLLKLFLKQINPKHIEIEVNHQIDKLKQSGLTINHLSSHQNTHLYPPILNICKKICKTKNIKYIRSQHAIETRLINYPIKYLLFKFSLFIFKLRYPSIHSNKFFFLENIVHPGTHYDK